MAKYSVHWNSNLLCAIDTETTGLIPGFHEIWQVCILPLTSDYKPNKEIIPFYQDLKIQYPERVDKKAISLTRNDFAVRQKRALDPFDAADLFEDWFMKLDLPIYKKIIPLAHNWPFDREFVKEWLGFHTFNDFFFYLYRDSMALSVALTDISDIKAERILINHHSLNRLCSKFNVVNEKAHDALQDCIATAKVYRRLLLSAS